MPYLKDSPVETLNYFPKKPKKKKNGKPVLPFLLEFKTDQLPFIHHLAAAWSHL